MATRFSADMSMALAFSKEEAERLQNSSVSPSHILLAMLRQNTSSAVEALHKLINDMQELKRRLEENALETSSSQVTSIHDIDFDIDASRVIRLGVLEARLMKSDAIDTIHVLMAILRANDNAASKILKNMGVTYDSLAQVVRANSQEKQEEQAEEQRNPIIMELSVGDEDSDTPASMDKQTKGQQQTQTPVLDNFGTDLTKAAKENLLDPVVGREAEIERLAQILCRRKKNNPILIGAPGCGKSAIVEGLAQLIVKHHISRSLWNKRVVMLDMACVVAGTKYRGQFEERIRSITNELKKNPDVIVFIDEIHTIVGAGNAEGSMDAANILKPALARGEFQCIGATTTDEYRKSIEKDGALERRFQKVQVAPTSPEETLQILNNLKSRYEDFHHVEFTQEALEACVKLTGRFMTERCFPDKAIDAMDETGSRLHINSKPVPKEITDLEEKLKNLQDNKLEAAQKQNFELAADYRDQAVQIEHQLEAAQKEWEKSLDEQRQVVSETDVALVISKMTGIPVQRIGQKETERLRTLKETLQKKIIGQNEAVDTIVRAIQRSRIGLKDPKRPIGTFMFVGPTGVGKTYLTKCLAEELFGSEDAIIRIDMSEYMEKHTVSRMVGAPPGYVGYEEGGQLTERVRRKPYSIVLLDEIEKAHQDVFNILLQVMDEGRLTDGNGNTVDFRNTIIIMTSNCGTRQINEFGNGIGFTANTNPQSEAANHQLVMKALSKQFAPEFLNRIDDVVFFNQLNEESLQRIVDLELAPLLGRVQEMGHVLNVTDAARHLLAKCGYDVKYGARPLRRAIQNMLENPLCEMLLQANVATDATLTADIMPESDSQKNGEESNKNKELAITAD